VERIEKLRKPYTSFAYSYMLYIYTCTILLTSTQEYAVYTGVIITVLGELIFNTASYDTSTYIIERQLSTGRLHAF
jgi:hypothetical protein